MCVWGGQGDPWFGMRGEGRNGPFRGRFACDAFSRKSGGIWKTEPAKVQVKWKPKEPYRRLSSCCRITYRVFTAMFGLR